MIRQFDAEEFELQKSTIMKISEILSQGQITTEAMYERIAEPFGKGNLAIHGFYRESENALLGVVFIGHVSNVISCLYTDDDLIDDEKEIAKIERTLIDFAIEKLRKNGKPIGIPGQLAIERRHIMLMDIGFDAYERAFMDVEQDVILSLDEPSLPKGYSFESFNGDDRDEVAQLVYDSNIGNIDVHVFPQFFGTEEDCKKLIERIEENTYGQYEPNSSTVLKLDGEIVGVCFITVRGDTAYIPEIAISPEYRRKGLGYAIALHALSKAALSSDEITKLGLDVTLANPALNLYKKLGFQAKREYSVYWYVPKSN